MAKIIKGTPPFIAVVGPNGAGKSTLVRQLEVDYQQRGLAAISSFEPGGTPIGKEFRRILKDPQYFGTFPPLAELFGFLASRAAYVEHIVKPALAVGVIVLTDRFSLCTMAFQIAGRGLPEDECMTAIRLAEGGVNPKYVVLLASPDVGLRRKLEEEGSGDDRFEKESLDFQQRVYDGYRRYGTRVDAIMVDTDRMSTNEVLEHVRQELDMRYWRSLHVAKAE